MQNAREYETLYILRPDMADDAMIQVNNRLKDVLDREGAKVLKCAVWGKKRLAFEVAKAPKGIFVQMLFLSEPTVVREFERNLRMLEPVVRYQTIRMADNVDVDKRLAEQAAEDQAKATADAAAAAEASAREEARAAEEAAKAAELAAAAPAVEEAAAPAEQKAAAPAEVKADPPAAEMAAEPAAEPTAEKKEGEE